MDRNEIKDKELMFKDMNEEVKRSEEGVLLVKEPLKGSIRITGRYDCNGKPLEEVLNRDEKSVKEYKEKVKAVGRMVASAVTADTIKSAYFYVMETNVFAKIDEEGVFVPAEISVAKFSLLEGLVSVYQAFPSAGVVPLGYKRECIENSNKGHKIPLMKKPMNHLERMLEDCVEFDVKEDGDIFNELSKFLSATDTVFCMPDKVAQCEGVLTTMSIRSTLLMPVRRFLDLPQLLFRLVNSTKEGVKIPSLGLFERELESER